MAIGRRRLPGRDQAKLKAFACEPGYFPKKNDAPDRINPGVRTIRRDPPATLIALSPASLVTPSTESGRSHRPRAVACHRSRRTHSRSTIDTSSAADLFRSSGKTIRCRKTSEGRLQSLS
jgi:hypothetical protein